MKEMFFLVYRIFSYSIFPEENSMIWQDLLILIILPLFFTRIEILYPRLRYFLVLKHMPYQTEQ